MVFRTSIQEALLKPSLVTFSMLRQACQSMQKSITILQFQPRLTDQRDLMMLQSTMDSRTSMEALHSTRILLREEWSPTTCGHSPIHSRSLSQPPTHGSDLTFLMRQTVDPTHTLRSSKLQRLQLRLRLKILRTVKSDQMSGA